jgi:type IV pilus assembly protein PilF
MGARRAGWRLIASSIVVLVVHMMSGCGPSPQVRLQADDRYQLAQSYLGNRSYHFAEREVRKALELVPDEARYYELLALIHQAQGRLQPAEEAYRLALQQPNVPPSVLVNYSTLLLLRERPDEAITLARRALQEPRYNKPALAYTNLGLAYFKKGALQQAMEHFRSALEYQPDLPEAHYNLGLVYVALGQHETAIRAFREAIRYRPAYVEAHASLGAALLQVGRKAEARLAFERVIALAPDSDMAVASQKQLQHLTP